MCHPTLGFQSLGLLRVRRIVFRPPRRIRHQRIFLAICSGHEQAEYLDFSNATSSNNVSVNLDGAGIQKILTGSTSNSNAGILDLKLDAGHNDTLTLAANGTYSYWDAATGGNQISNGTSATSVNVSALTTAGADIYVFDSTHTTLLADLHYHV